MTAFFVPSSRALGCRMPIDLNLARSIASFKRHLKAYYSTSALIMNAESSSVEFEYVVVCLVGSTL